MANIGLCKRDMAVLPQQQLLAASPFASLAFAQAILERNNTATGLYTPLHLIYAPEEAQAEAPAPQVQVDLHLTLAAEKPGQGKAETVREKTIESMTERTVERILRERRSLERSVIRQAAPTIQNFYHTSVRAALERRETFLQGPVAQAKAMAAAATARQKAPEPVQLRYAQVLRRNQEAGLTASTRAPAERQAFPPAQAAASSTAPAAPAKAGGVQARQEQPDRVHTVQGQATVPAIPAGQAEAPQAEAPQVEAPQVAASQAEAPQGQAAAIAASKRPEQEAIPQGIAPGPVGQPAALDMAPLVLQQAEPQGGQAQPGAERPIAAQAASEGMTLAPGPSASLASPAPLTYRQEEAAAQAGREPRASAPSSGKAAEAARAGTGAQAPAARPGSEKQPSHGQDIAPQGAARPAARQPLADGDGEGAQPERADSQPVMAQRALGQAAEPAPLGEALQYAPIQAPGQTSEPGPGPRQREETAEQPAAKAATAKKQTERPQTAQEEAQQTAKAEARRAVQAERKKAGQAQRPQAGRAAAEGEAQAASLAADRSAPLAQAPAQPVAATGGIQPGAPLVYGPAPQELPELGMQLPWHRAAQPLGQQLAQALPRQLPAAGSQGLGRVFRPLGSVKSPGHMTGFRPQQAQGPEPPAAAGAGRFQRQPLTYAAGRAQAPQAPEAAPARREKAAPAQGGYTESPYVQSLPGWARDFLRESFTQPKQGAAAQPKAGGQAGQGQPGASQTAAKGQPPSQMVWTAPGYTGATARMTHKKKPEPQEAPPPLRFSDAEIKRMASQVYTIIQERLKRDQRRLGL